ncbi:MAG: hypothetical protein ACXACI_01945 [Candidatus Hodarchaeales archaeon]|jgi:hypothetical protein
MGGDSMIDPILCEMLNSLLDRLDRLADTQDRIADTLRNISKQFMLRSLG